MSKPKPTSTISRSDTNGLSTWPISKTSWLNSGLDNIENEDPGRVDDTLLTRVPKLCHPYLYSGDRRRATLVGFCHPSASDEDLGEFRCLKGDYSLTELNLGSLD